MPTTLSATDTTPNLGDLVADLVALFELRDVLGPSGGETLGVQNARVRKAFPAHILEALAVGQGALYTVQRGSLRRWSWGMTGDDETGGNAGNDWGLLRYSDAGDFLSVPLRVLRASGDLVAGSSVRPSADGTFSLGAGGARWSTVYASTGVINTSDAREKTNVRALSAAEIAAGKDLSAEIGAFKFLAAIAAKGEPNARTHIGMTVQRAIEVMESHGLDPFSYGFICYDSWPAESATETQPARPAGDRYSLRPDELLLFIARGFEARLAALEAASA